VDEVNDLGAVIDSRLTFRTHIRQNVMHASIGANLIHKCFISRAIFTLIRAFKVYVRPILELIQKSYQFINVVNGVSHSYKTANIFFSFDSLA